MGHQIIVKASVPSSRRIAKVTLPGRFFEAAHPKPSIENSQCHRLGKASSLHQLAQAFVIGFFNSVHAHQYKWSTSANTDLLPIGLKTLPQLVEFRFIGVLHARVVDFDFARLWINSLNKIQACDEQILSVFHDHNYGMQLLPAFKSAMQLSFSG